MTILSASINSAHPRVAILMAAYNGLEWLPEQLGSILLQKGVDLTIFISVDRSNDGTESWLEHFSGEMPRIVLLPTGTHFGAASRNFFRLLRDVNIDCFDYVAFADQDDVWLSDHLSRAISLLGEGFDACSSNVTAFWSSGKEQLIKKSQPQRKWDFLFESPGPGCTFVMRRDFVISVQSAITLNWATLQQLDYHDWFVYAHARANGYRWIIDDYASVRYRQHDDNVLGANAGLGAFWSRLQHVVRGNGFKQAELIASVTGLSEEPFVLSWTSRRRRGFFRLALSANQCRRRKRDRVYFAFLCLFYCVFGQSF